jgi:hypothetical protein
MSKGYVQKYLWHNHGLPFHKAWQITLTANEAIAFLAFVTALVAYAQTKAWRLACLAVKRITRPIQLPDHDSPDSLQHLSQRDAILIFIVFSWRLIRRQPRPTTILLPNGMKSVSPWFGIAAVINLIAFICLGAVIPWVLTGGLGIPVIQSKAWDGCSHGMEANHFEIAYRSSDNYRNCWHNHSKIPEFCSQQDGALLDRPFMYESRNVSCPFQEIACQGDVQPLQLEYVNLTLREYGMNIFSRLLHSRRLTCAPLKLSRLIMQDSTGKTWLSFSKPYPSPHVELRLQLSSPDGRTSDPWGPFDHFTGLEIDKGPPRLRFWAAQASVNTNGSRYFHVRVRPEFERYDGQIVFLAFNAGWLRYGTPMDDPMYFAHLQYSQASVYAPDYEYTALACLEQHQFCIAGHLGACSPYLSLTDAQQHISQEAKRLMHDTITKDLGAFSEAFAWSSIAAFIRARGSSPLLSYHTDLSGLWAPRVDPVDQWTREVKSWFESSFLTFRVFLQFKATGKFLGSFVRDDEELRERLCAHILLRDSNYTNINFFGLVMTLFAVAMISAFSHARKLASCTRRAMRFFTTVFEQFCSGFGGCGSNANLFRCGLGSAAGKIQTRNPLEFLQLLTWRLRMILRSLRRPRRRF